MSQHLNANLGAGYQVNRTISGGAHHRQFNTDLVQYNVGPVSQPRHHQDGRDNTQFNAEILLMAQHHQSNRAETPPVPISTVPWYLGIGSNFVDRPELLQQIESILSVPRAWAALVGAAGVGKTQLMAEHAKRIREKSQDVWILWINASNERRFNLSVRQIVNRIKPQRLHEARADLLELLEDWLCEAGKRRWLVVFNDVDDLDLLLQDKIGLDGLRRIDYFPACEHGSIVITTRNMGGLRNSVPQPNIIQVPALEPDQAMVLLDKVLSHEGDVQAKTRLTEVLEYIPLSLVQVTAYIRAQKPDYSAADCLERLENDQRERIALLGQDSEMLGRDRDASGSIIRTWTHTLDNIRRKRSSAADLISLLSFCELESFPDELLQDLVGLWNQVQGDRGAISANKTTVLRSVDHASAADVVLLQGYHLITVYSHCPLKWHMSRTVMDAVQHWRYALNEADAIQTCAAEVKAAYVSSVAPMVVQGDSKQRVQAINNKARKRTTIQRMRPRRASQLGASQEHRRSLQLIRVQKSRAGAEKLFAKVMETMRRVLRAEHSSTLTSMNNLASTYSVQGRWLEAEELQVKVMEISNRVLGEKHSDTLSKLSSMNNLAVTYYEQGKLQQAHQLMASCVEALIKKIGSSHPNTKVSVSWLETMQSALEVQDSKEAPRQKSRIMGLWHKLRRK